jgi:hypothetical protein
MQQVPVFWKFPLLQGVAGDTEKHDALPSGRKAHGTPGLEHAETKETFMVSGLRRLWRGDIQLQKTFWFFGIVVLLLFSFTFIRSQAIIAAIIGKASNAILYLDCFLALIFVVL